MDTMILFLFYLRVSNLDSSKVDTKPDFQVNLSIAETFPDSVYIEMRSGSKSDNFSDENTISTQIVGKRRYIRGTVIDNVETKKWTCSWGHWWYLCLYCTIKKWYFESL